MGDFNICINESRNHPIILTLSSLKFEQKNQSPTHVLGRCIDHVYFFNPEDSENMTAVEILQFGQFFTDHDMLLVAMPQR